MSKTHFDVNVVVVDAFNVAHSVFRFGGYTFFDLTNQITVTCCNKMILTFLWQLSFSEYSSVNGILSDHLLHPLNMFYSEA